jgi:hypothetical protein
MNYKYRCLCEEVFNEAYNTLSEEETNYMYDIIREASAIVVFASYAERLLFEAAMKKGFLATKLEKI